MVEKKLEGIQLLFRILAVVSGIIVLALTVDKLKGKSVCVYHSPSYDENETCNFGIAMGAISLIVGVVLSLVNILALLLPAPLALIVLPGGRRGKLAILDLVISVVVAVLWIACAIYTTVEYEKVDDMFRFNEDSAVAAIVFNYLSFVLWFVAGMLAIPIHRASDTILPGDN